MEIQEPGTEPRPPQPEPAEGEQPARVGPRGGTTTVAQAGMVRKNFWLPDPINELLRRRCYEQRRSESDLIREALYRLLRTERP